MSKTAEMQMKIAELLQANEAAMTLVEQLTAERDALVAQAEALQRSAVPNEHGKNRYGLDVAYFRNVINRELNRSLMDFKPSELARVFARLSKTADDSVLLENEFIGDHLPELRAEAGRAGYLKCHDDFGNGEIWKIAGVSHVELAEQYADSIRRGEVE